MARAWTAGRTAEATAARLTLEVHPDELYERFHAARLPHVRDPAQRALYEQALARATRSHDVAEQRDVPIAPRPWQIAGIALGTSKQAQVMARFVGPHRTG